MIFCLQTGCCCSHIITPITCKRGLLILDPSLASLTQHRHKWGEFTHNESWRRRYHAVALDERRLHMHKPVCERRAGDTDDWRMERGDTLTIPHVITHTDEELSAGSRCRRHRVSYGSHLWLTKWMDHLHAYGSFATLVLHNIQECLSAVPPPCLALIRSENRLFVAYKK